MADGERKEELIHIKGTNKCKRQATQGGYKSLALEALRPGVPLRVKKRSFLGRGG